MTVFHLNVFSNVDAQDNEGIERPNLEVAKLEAMAGVRDLIAHDILDGKPIFRSHRIEITDDRYSAAYGSLRRYHRFEVIAALVLQRTAACHHVFAIVGWR